MKRFKGLVVALIVVAIAAGLEGVSQAGPATATTRAPASAATYVWAGTPLQNYNGATPLRASLIAFRMLLEFNTTVPLGSRIDSASLSLVPAVSGGGAFQVRSIKPFRPTKVTWASLPIIGPTVLGTSLPPQKGHAMTIPLSGRRFRGRLFLAVSYTVPDVVAAIANSSVSAPTLVLRFAPRGTPTTTTTRVAPTTTTARVPPSTTTTTRAQPSGLVVDAIGDAGPDLAHWNSPLATRLRGDHPAALLWAGDVRNTGTIQEWHLYDVNYGQLKSITLPTPGNHDWGLAKTGYNHEFASGAPWADTKTYCNAVALPNGWRLFSINTYSLASCLPMLTTWLNATPGTKKIVLTHEPRFSGGSGHGSSTAQAPIWDAMIGHAFALVSGHDHDSQVIEQNGVVQVVNGCAGAPYYSVTPIAGELYNSKSAADCTFDRFTLGAGTVKVEAVHADGSVAFTETFPVAS